MDYISIYAAIISTLSITWNIFSYFDNKKGRVKIIFDYDTTWELDDEKKISEMICKNVKFNLVNLGDKNRIIDSIQIYIVGDLLSDSFSIPVPIILEPLKPFSYSIPLKKILEYHNNYEKYALKNYTSKIIYYTFRMRKIKVIAKETTGQSYSAVHKYNFKGVRVMFNS